MCKLGAKVMHFPKGCFSIVSILPKLTQQSVFSIYIVTYPASCNVDRCDELHHSFSLDIQKVGCIEGGILYRIHFVVLFICFC